MIFFLFNMFSIKGIVMERVKLGVREVEWGRGWKRIKVVREIG